MRAFLNVEFQQPSTSPSLSLPLLVFGTSVLTTFVRQMRKEQTYCALAVLVTVVAASDAFLTLV